MSPSDKSSKTLSGTLDEFQDQDSTMSVNRRLTDKLRRRDLTDRVLLGTGLLWCVCVGVFVVSINILFFCLL
jgi:hypothetical protein